MLVIEKQIVTKEEIVTTDILCNKCSKSRKGFCGNYNGLIEAIIIGAYDSPAPADCQIYTFSLCEKCLLKLFEEFKIEVNMQHVMIIMTHRGYSDDADELDISSSIPTNSKLIQAIEYGNKLNQERITNENEKTIQFRLKQLLENDWIYSMISEEIGKGEKYLTLYNQSWFDDRENAEWTCAAINRIEGLSATVESENHPFSNKCNFFIRVNW